MRRFASILGLAVLFGSPSLMAQSAPAAPKKEGASQREIVSRDQAVSNNRYELAILTVKEMPDAAPTQILLAKFRVNTVAGGDVLIFPIEYNQTQSRAMLNTIQKFNRLKDEGARNNGVDAETHIGRIGNFEYYYVSTAVGRSILKIVDRGDELTSLTVDPTNPEFMSGVREKETRLVNLTYEDVLELEAFVKKVAYKAS